MPTTPRSSRGPTLSPPEILATFSSNMSYSSTLNPFHGERRCLPLRHKNLRISPPSFNDDVYHELKRIAQLEYSTDHMPNPPLRYDCEFMGPERSAEEMTRREIKAFREGGGKAHIAEGSALGRVKMERGLEMFHQSLDLATAGNPEPRENQIHPPHITLGREASEEERKGMGPETFLERRAAKMKADREVNMRLHGNLNRVYTGINSAQNQHERLRADERRGVDSILCANIDAYEEALEEANMPRMENLGVAQPPWSVDTPCGHRKPCNNVRPGCMSGFFGSRGLFPDLAVESRRRQVEMAKGNLKLSEELKKGELAGKSKEVDKNRMAREERTNGGEEDGRGEVKMDKLNEGSPQSEKSGARHEDECEGEDTEEAERKGTVEDTREDYVHVIQSNLLAECDGNRRTKEQLALLDHLSQQTPRPHNPKSKWILVNQIAEDGEEFVFVEKDE